MRLPSRILSSLTLLALLFSSLILAIPAAGNERDWTSADGRSLRATLLGSDGGFVLLRAVDNAQVYRVALENLSPSDRIRIQQSGLPALPVFDLQQPPAETEIAQLASGGPADFACNAAALRQGLLAGYSTDFHESVEAWYGVYRWLDLFQEKPFHRTEEQSERFGANWPDSLREFVLGDFEFTREFFNLLAPEDSIPDVGKILNRLHQTDPETFREYKSLALAIAIVYDVPSPGLWWASGVPPEMHPPGPSDPLETFSFFVSSHRAGQLLLDPRRLSPGELRFAVDLYAPFEELRWAQRQVRASIARFDRAYSMVNYDHERYSPELRELNMEWPHADYRLETILRRGGICVDQAYFSSQAGKARGLPTVYFTGSGENGGHAWMGYLQGPGRDWNTEVGRYELNNYVVGHMRDPQTWKRISDHELRFTNDRFHRSAEFRISRHHEAFAREFRLSGETSRALRAAQQAIKTEPRNRAAWNLILEINDDAGRPEASETTLKLAAEAFRHYPHVQADFLGTLGERIAARGDLDAAFDLLETVSRRNRGQQADISVASLKRLLNLARTSNDPDLLIRGYRRTLTSLANYAPAGLFLHEIANPFLIALHERGEQTQARILVARTRQRLRPAPGTLADRGLQELEERLR